jgi:hypothetical protein
MATILACAPRRRQRGHEPVRSAREPMAAAVSCVYWAFRRAVRTVMGGGCPLLAQLADPPRRTIAGPRVGGRLVTVSGDGLRLDGGSRGRKLVRERSQ